MNQSSITTKHYITIKRYSAILSGNTTWIKHYWWPLMTINLYIHPKLHLYRSVRRRNIPKWNEENHDQTKFGCFPLNFQTKPYINNHWYIRIFPSQFHDISIISPIISSYPHQKHESCPQVIQHEIGQNLYINIAMFRVGKSSNFQ